MGVAPLSYDELAALDRIEIAYAIDRAERDGVAALRADLDRDVPPGPLDPHPDASPIPGQSCRYCGRRHTPWFGSRLDGHALCVVSDGFKEFVGQQMRAHHRLTYAVVARAVGVTDSVVRAWFRWYADRHPWRPQSRTVRA